MKKLISFIPTQHMPNPKSALKKFKKFVDEAYRHMKNNLKKAEERRKFEIWKNIKV